MNLEECIKDLDPELREKAHACGSEDELRSFLENEAIPIPDVARPPPRMSSKAPPPSPVRLHKARPIDHAP